MKTFIESDNNMEYGVPHERKFIKRKRKCRLCKMLLSGYNEDDKCLHHIPSDKEKVIRNAYGQHGSRFKNV